MPILLAVLAVHPNLTESVLGADQAHRSHRLSAVEVGFSEPLVAFVLISGYHLFCSDY